LKIARKISNDCVILGKIYRKTRKIAKIAGFEWCDVAGGGDNNLIQSNELGAAYPQEEFDGGFANAGITVGNGIGARWT
jgi:hypothetical protein